MLMSSSETQEKLDKHNKKIEDKVENTEGAPNISWLGDSERIAGVMMLKQNPKG